MYNFSEIKQFLKDNNLWGMQCFPNKNSINEPVETIYSKDNVSIGIHMGKHNEGYLEIIGLTEQDFTIIEDAFISTINTNSMLGKMVVDVTLKERQYRRKQQNKLPNVDH